MYKGVGFSTAAVLCSNIIMLLSSKKNNNDNSQSQTVNTSEQKLNNESLVLGQNHL